MKYTLFDNLSIGQGDYISFLHAKRPVVLFPPLFMITTAILLLGVCPSFGQGKSEVPSKDEARVLRQRAVEETNLRATGSSPFHLLARAKSFGGKGEIVEGTYEVWWEANDHWSRRIRWANSAQVDVVDNNRIWKQGEDTHLVESSRLRRILDFWFELKMSAEGKIRKVKSEELDGHPVACVQIPLERPGLPPTALVVSSSIPSERTICMESTSGFPLKFDTGASRLELGEYMAFSQKRFPKTLRLVYSGKTIMEIEVESLAGFDSTKRDVFAVPVGAASRPWCSDMVRPQPTRLGDARQVPFVGPPNGVVLPLNPPDITKYSVILFQVGEKGNALDVRAFVPGGEVLLKDGEKTSLLKSNFRPATCNGKAIEAEFPMEFHFPHILKIQSAVPNDSLLCLFDIRRPIESCAFSNATVAL